MKFEKRTMNLILLVLAAATFHCKDKGTDPPSAGQDTTSHEFSWTLEPLGDGAGSMLYDVAIIQEGDSLVAYAVGAIYKRDTLGNWDPNAYNMAKWNGRGWQLMRILFYTICGQSGTGSYPAKSIFAFGPQDIWIAMDGSQVVRWNGQSQGPPMCTPVSINKLWGESPSSVYAVGNDGGIAHYGNSTWQRIESGTTLGIRDIWGARDLVTGVQQILAVASNDTEKRLLQIQGTTASFVSDSGLSNSLYGVWFSPNQKYYIVGAGIHQKTSLSDPIWSRYPSGVVTSYGSGGVRGNGINDIFVVGSFLEVVHFNGSSWYNYRKEIPFADGALGAIAIKGNLVIAVGLAGQQAVAVIGRR